MRIASLLASSTEILFGLGAGEQVVAISHECDFPAEALRLPRATESLILDQGSSLDIDEQVRQRLDEGKPLYGIDEALLCRLAPDLIITQAQCDVCAIRFEEVQSIVEGNQQLAHTSILTLAPATLPEVFDDIRRIAEVLHREEAAQQWLNELQQRLHAVQRATVAGNPSNASMPRPRVAIVEWLEPLMVAANWTPELVWSAGGDHRLTKNGQHSTYWKWSALAEYDPEVVIIAPCGFDLERTRQEWMVVRQQSCWQQLAAVQANRVYLMDGNVYLNRSGPRLVDTVEALAQIIHPTAAVPAPPLTVPIFAQVDP